MTDSDDRWASTPAAYLTVAGAISVLIVAVLTAACGWTAGLIAAAILGAGSAAAVILLACAIGLIDRSRDQRARHAATRATAFDGHPPRPVELQQDFTAVVVRFPYPADPPDLLRRQHEMTDPHSPTTGRSPLRLTGVRIRVAGEQRPALVLTDTPRPDCRHCLGAGWWAEYVQDGPDPEDGERLDHQCDCWSNRRRRFLPIPARVARRLGWLPTDSAYSTEPPF